MPLAEWHVASLIVHAVPSRTAAVRRRIAAHPGAEIHAETPGRLIVVLEAASEAELAERMTALGRLDDVMAATLVFHQVETEAAPEREPEREKEESTPC
ncbi:chaperone NapD [Azospirillum sp. ST 5-10]|uniref:chaperone NapD n=1 Tax=unclassified Azospirillum TaxID=2630922 RepID=UPI003F4A1E03